LNKEIQTKSHDKPLINLFIVIYLEVFQIENNTLCLVFPMML